MGRGWRSDFGGVSGLRSGGIGNGHFELSADFLSRGVSLAPLRRPWKPQEQSALSQPCGTVSALGLVT